MKEFIGLRAKTYSYLTDDSSEYEKAKYTKNVSLKNLNLKIKKSYLEATQLENKINHLEKSEIDVDSL